jgi:hypothetical protein
METKPQLVTVVPKFPATITHGIPGLAIGAIIIGSLIVNHVILSVWHSIPELLSIGLLTFGLVWLYSLIRGVSHGIVKDTDAAQAGVAISLIIAFVGFVSFFISWTAGHPGNPTEVSCRLHQGYFNRAPRGDNYPGSFVVFCKDGYNFVAP